MAKMTIDNKTYKVKEIEINPHVDDSQKLFHESIKVKLDEAPKLKLKGVYDLTLEGENEQTSKTDTYSYKGYRVGHIDNKSLLLLHPDFYYNYELTITIEPQT